MHRLGPLLPADLEMEGRARPAPPRFLLEILQGPRHVSLPQAVAAFPGHGGQRLRRRRFRARLCRRAHQHRRARRMGNAGRARPACHSRAAPRLQNGLEGREPPLQESHAPAFAPSDRLPFRRRTGDRVVGVLAVRIDGAHVSRSHRPGARSSLRRRGACWQRNISSGTRRRTCGV